MLPMNDTNKIRPEKETGKSEKIFQAVCFSLDGIEYGIDVNRVTEIIRPVEIMDASGSPSFIQGTINYHEQEVLLMDLRKRLGLKNMEAGENIRIVVAEYEGKMIGLTVDAVTAVIRMDEAQIAQSFDINIPSGEAILKAVYRDDDKQIPIMDCACIFDF